MGWQTVGHLQQRLTVVSLSIMSLVEPGSDSQTEREHGFKATLSICF